MWNYFSHFFFVKLKEEYPIIEKAVEKSFIKPSSFNTKAVLLFFNLQEQTY